MNRTPAYTVIVNSSDGYADCWSPFFELLHRFWPELKAPILLNTDTLDCPPEARGTLSTRFGLGTTSRLPWGEALRYALSQVDTPLVLYFQEDYFLDAPVLGEEVERLAQLMLDRPNVGCVQLTDIGSLGPFFADEDPSLWKVSARSRYRINCQVTLWRREVLESYVFPDENGWMFELLGTIRSRSERREFLAVNRDIYGKSRPHIFHYLHTGIIKGKWHRELPAIFERLKIDCDFSKRGFYRELPPLLRKFETARKVITRPDKLLEAYAGARRRAEKGAT